METCKDNIQPVTLERSQLKFAMCDKYKELLIML